MLSFITLCYAAARGGVGRFSPRFGTRICPANGFAQPSPHSDGTKRLVHEFQVTSFRAARLQARRFDMDVELCGCALLGGVLVEVRLSRCFKFLKWEFEVVQVQRNLPTRPRELELAR